MESKVILTEFICFRHLYSLITTHDDFDSANPSSMQDRRLSHMNSVKMALLSMTRLKTLVSNLTISLSPMMCQHCSSMFL